MATFGWKLDMWRSSENSDEEKTLESDCDEISQWLEVLRTHWRVNFSSEFLAEMFFDHAEKLVAFLIASGSFWTSMIKLFFSWSYIYAWYTHKTLISYYLPAFKLSFISSKQVFIVYLSRIVSPAFISQLKSWICKVLSWIYTSIYTTVSPMPLSIIRSNTKSTVEILKTLFLHVNNFQWIASLHFYLLLGRSRLANLAMSIFCCSICGTNLYIELICCKLKFKMQWVGFCSCFSLVI